MERLDGTVSLGRVSRYGCSLLRCARWTGAAPMERIGDGARDGAAILRFGALVEDAVRISVHRYRRAGWRAMTGKPKVVVVMPAYNAAKTLHMTYSDLPRDMVDLIILVDDGSKD